MNHTWKQLLLSLTLLCAAGLTTGCGDDSGPADAPKETTPAPGDTTLLVQCLPGQIS